MQLSWCMGKKCADLLAMNALTGSDRVCYPDWRGKVSGFNVITKNELGLDKVFGRNTSEFIEKGTEFFCLLYGTKKIMKMKELGNTM